MNHSIESSAATRLAHACLMVSLCVATFGRASSPALGQGQGISTGDGAWTWQNPAPQGNDLNDVQFADTQNGWAVGRGGLIMRTTDGGASWVIQSSGAQEDLNGLAVLDVRTAVAVGGAGAILQTTDGATWERRTGGGTAELRRVQYADATTLYTVGDRGTFLTSQDGGLTWVLQYPLSTDRDLTRVQFFDALTGLVMSPKAGEGWPIFATGDGGASWSRLGVPTDLRLQNFRFLNSGTGVAIGEGGVLIKTTNSGVTWRLISTPTAADLFAAAYSDDGTVHAVGDGGVVLKSVDGGESWAILPDPRPAAAHLHAVRFVDSTSGFAVGFNGTILRTTNAGASWVPLAQGARNALRSVHFVDESTGVAVGQRGTIVRSSDGGDTWRPIPSGTQRDLYGVRFLNRQIGLVVGDAGVVLRTEDGGETWQPSRSVPIARNLRGVGLAGDPITGRLEVAVAVGDTGLVMRSVDQGVTWTTIRLPGTADQLLAVHFPEPRIGYIGGRQTIYQTTDFGATWRVVAGGTAPRTPPRDPLDFAFPSVNRGYAVGQNGQIHRSDDGGTTWQVLPSRTTVTLRSVDFVDEETGYIVGDNGTVLVTNNGGGTWTAVYSGTHLNLWGVQFVNRGVGLTVGEGGAVLKTTSGGLPTRNVPPGVVAVSPVDQQTNVVVGDRVRVTFNKDIEFADTSYGEGGAFQVRDANARLIPAQASYVARDRQVQIAPLAPLAEGTSYTVHVRGGPTGVTDLEGRAMVFDFRGSFRTGCAITPQAGFGRLVATNAEVRDRIGCALEDESGIDAAEQLFDGGQMLWVQQWGQILVHTYVDGRWAAYADTLVAGEAEPDLAPPDGRVAPSGGFGRLWREQPGVSTALGWAIGTERPFVGAAQPFGGGRMVWTGPAGGLLRVYYADGATFVAADAPGAVSPSAAQLTPPTTPISPGPIETPRLIRPAAGATIPQNDSSIGCAAHPTGGYGLRIVFEWEPVAGARAYEVVAQRAGLRPLVSTAVRVPVLNLTTCNTFIPDSILDGWSWRVRALGSGAPGEWSPTRAFSFAPCRVDGEVCSLTQ